MDQLAEQIDGLPNISGSESRVEAAIAAGRRQPVFHTQGNRFDGVASAFAVALHMHQPLIPAGGPELRTARVISNLQYMLEHQDVGDNHNAPVFLRCYQRMGEIVPRLSDEGRQPRVMLEYSGTLLHGLRQIGVSEVIDALRRITCDPRYRRRRRVAWVLVGARRRALHTGPGLPPACPGLATSLRGAVRIGRAGPCAGFLAGGDGVAEPSRRRARVRAHPARLWI